MKKIKLLGLLSVFASATMMADPIDIEKAKLLAQPFIGEGSTPSLVKSAQRNETKSRNLDAATKATAPYYIFSRGDNQGFVIVSGDDCLPEILGYTESGNFDEELMPPHLLSWLDHYAGLVEEAQAQGTNSTSEANTRSTIDATLRTATKVNVEPLVTAHWHQNGPYNNRCPYLTGTTNRAVTGCVATAAAQIIYYWRKDNPSTLLATTPTYGYGDAPVTTSIPAGTPMKWDLMLDSYNGSRPAEYDDAVATLNAAVGAATWLTYGNSTGGQISDLVNTFNSYFRMSSECQYKGGENQAAWESKIYNELIAGQPIVYCGYNASSGGHAVVLDGYQASTNLFHFNFGWGGQGDGWYTVNDENGMNGFNEQQGMTYKIKPKQRNVNVEIAHNETLLLNRTNSIRIKVSNNSTLPFSGIYLFASTGSKPSSLSSAKDENVETVISNDGKAAYITLDFKPTLAREYTLWVTDANMKTLATTTMTPQAVKSELQFNGIDIYASSDMEEHGGEQYKVVYNPNKAVCEFEMTNISDIDYEGSPKFELYGSTDNGETFEYIGVKTGSITLAAGSSGKATVNINNTSTCPVVTDVLYRLKVVNPIKSGSSSDTLQFATPDSIARFVLRSGDLEAASYDNRCLKLTGKWDYNKFLSIGKSNSYKDATSFDLTEVEGIGSMPVFEQNPNALFYIADNTELEGKNIVRKSDASCTDLALTAGYDFMPLGNINAGEFTLNIAQAANHWYMLTSPCTVAVPDGIIAREVNTHNKTTGISNKTTNVTTLEAGKAYLVMTSSRFNQTLTAKDCSAIASPGENTDPAFVGTFAATAVPAGGMLIDITDDYFSIIEEGAVSEGMRGYFYDEATTREFRAYSSINIDNKCITLGEAIDSCRSTMDQYAHLASTAAYQTLSDSLGKGEKIFSERTLAATEITAYTKVLLQCLDEFIAQKDGGEEPEDKSDYTAFITNPSFELGSTAGWTVESKTTATAKSASSLTYKGVGSDGNYLLYNINTADSTGVSISQTVSGLIPGTYRLTAMVGTSEGRTVTMFANELKTTVEAHAFGKFYLTEAVIENITVGADGTMGIGIESGDWYKADNFRLTLIEESIADGIECITSPSGTSDIIAAPVAGGIAVSASAPTKVTIHNISGVTIWSKVVSGTETIALPKGMYIVGRKKIAVY